MTGMDVLRILLIAGGAAMAVSCGGEAPPKREAPARPVAKAAAAAALPAVDVGAEIASFYKERGFKPLWVRRSGLTPAGERLLEMIGRAGEDGLDPSKYGLPLLRSAAGAVAGGDAATVAKAELLLSRAFADYVRDLHQPANEKAVFFVDEELAPARTSRREVLEAAAAAPSLERHLEQAGQMNPLYEALRTALAQYRSSGGDPAGERLLLANMERARSIPANPGRRYVIVDTAGARLWMVEGRKVVDSMKVIVGKPDMATPEMAGLIRYLTLNPYWNMPPDLARERAKKVLKRGPGVVAAERLQILSDWSDRPRVLNASQVNWRAVASGAQPLRMRQLPGGDNMMGNVKFMLPNRLGIYLHDTPNKANFQLLERRLSSGCVRVEDAQRLSRWLFGGKVVRPSGPAPEQNVDLPEPVPVYITYLTAVPKAGGGALFRPDVYRRDARMLAMVDDRARQRRA
jgi:murein L,D-transpeptidase YcbB/YkuD